MFITFYFYSLSFRTNSLSLRQQGLICTQQDITDSVVDPKFIDTNATKVLFGVNDC